MSELSRMARMMVTDEGGLRPITDGDRAILARTNDIGALTELLRQMLELFKAKRPPIYGVTTVLVALLSVACVLSLVFLPLGATATFFVGLVFVYYLNHRAGAAAKRRRIAFRAWYDAIAKRMDEIDAGDIARADAIPPEGTTYELAGLPAPVFIGADIRNIREEDRIVIRASSNVEALSALSARLNAHSDAAAARQWLDAWTPASDNR